MLVKYNNSILNLANSIREYYGLDTYYDTDKDVSEWLNTNKFKHLFILLLIIYHKIYIKIVIQKLSDWILFTCVQIIIVYVITTASICINIMS